MPDGAPSNLDAPDVMAALRRTAPEDLAPVNIEALVRVGRRRRHRLTALASVAAVLVVGAAAAGLMSSRDDPPNVAVADGGPALSEPVGTWRQAADPPFEPRMDAFAATLSDGRMLVWGGHNDTGDGTEGPHGLSDGGIYDPTTDTWEEIPSAPVESPATGGRSITSAQLVDDRLATVVADDDGRLHAAVYDVSERSWVAAPEQDEIPEVHDAMAWDGETLVLARISNRHGGQIEEPMTLRWRVSDDSWASGAPFPLGVRNLAGATFDGSQLAIWGGTEQDFVSDEEHQVFGDGAIYDVAGDTWQPMADGPLAAGTHAEMTWLDGRLVVAGRMGANGDYPRDLAAYDQESETWETLPESPDGYAAVVTPSAYGHVEGEEPLLVAGFFDVEDDESLPIDGVADEASQPEGRWYYDDAAWEQAPRSSLLRMGDRLVAFDPSRSAPLELQVRAAGDQWLSGEEAPFANRMSEAIVTNDNSMLVVSPTGSDDEPEGGAWVFELDG